MSVSIGTLSFPVTELFYFSVCRFAPLTTASSADRQRSYLKPYTFYFRVRISPLLRQTSMNLLEVIQTKNIVNFGLATFVAAALLGNIPSAKAETTDIFTKHGLPIPGAYFAKKETSKPIMITVTKSAKTVGNQKQTAPEVGKKLPQQAHLANATS